MQVMLCVILFFVEDAVSFEKDTKSFRQLTTKVEVEYHLAKKGIRRVRTE